MFQKGDLIRAVAQPMRFAPYEQLIVLIPTGNVRREKAHHQHGDKYMMVTKVENYKTFKNHHPSVLYDLWRQGKSEIYPIFLFQHDKFEMWSGSNIYNARYSLEVFE